MLLLLVVVLVPINNFCRFLQTTSLNYSLIISKFQRVVTKLCKIKENLPSYDAADVSLRYLQLASDLLKFPEITSSKAKSLRSRVEHHLHNNQCINKFIAQVGDPLITDLIVEIEDDKKELLLFFLVLTFSTPKLWINQRRIEWIFRNTVIIMVAQLMTLLRSSNYCYPCV